MPDGNFPMFGRAAAAVAILACLALAAPPAGAQQVAEYRPVTDAELRDPPPADWLMYRRTYNGWGYSPLDQITAGNVAGLQPAWAFATGLTDGHESPPVVNDGAMFITTPQNNVIALDARTGDMRWRYARALPEELLQIHPTNRGVALYGDKVYMATVDSFVVALDAETGNVVWESPAGDWQTGYYMTMAPLTVNGKVLVGVSGGELGIRGFVAAFDAETGAEVWRTHTVPGPGEPGNETWPGDTWQTGATPVWVTGTYDPELNLTYWGTGNAGPWMGDQRPGDNLYANSVIALDADTGELRGHHQYHWNGSWDWDEVAPPLLIDIDRGGRTVKGLVHPGRNGYLWLLERAADRIGFIDATSYVYQNAFTRLDPETGRPEYDPEHKPRTGTRLSFCPSIWGGKNWPPAAFNPVTGYLYFSANDNLCAFMNTREVEYSPGKPFTGGSSQMYVRDGADHIGELQAWDLDSGEEVWTREFESHNWGPVLTTASGLVFAGGTNDRYFRAFDGRTGETLWEQRTSSGVIGVPTSYMVDGVQYIAVQAGWGLDAARMQNALDRSRGTTTLLPQGGVLWVFSLPR